MKLIIDIDEKYYEACKDAVEEYYPSQVEEIIANGTPITEGDLISRSALKEEFDDYIKANPDISGIFEIGKFIINKAPSIGGN